MMLEIAICDDENIYRTDLKKIIERELDLQGIVHRIIEYESGEALIARQGNQTPQIFFLDIEMKELNGFDTAKEIRRRDQNAVIVFVTSYSDFVFQGYEVRALNYILKPYQPERICSVLHTALQELDYSQEQYYLIEHRSGSVRLPLNTVKYFCSDKRSVTAVTVDCDYSFYQKLNEVEKELPPNFIRIHSRYLINLRFLHSIDGNKALIDQEELPVSRSCKQVLAVAFAKYILD